MAELLVLIPCAFAAIAFAIPSNRWRPMVLPVGALVNLVLSYQALQETDLTGLSEWLRLDPMGKVVLGLTAVMYFLCSGYAPGYLTSRPERDNRVLCACQMLLLAMMNLIVLSHHLGLLWVAMEATTLVSAPGLYFNHNARSLEATWKYLLICSVGIALALLGSLFFAYSALHSGLETTLMFDDLIKEAPQLSKPWLHAAFIILLVGYGTKMGLAPMHTWKPDAYGEAPGMIGALLAGCMTNCAFLSILRFVHIARAAGEREFVDKILIFVGLFSMAVAAVFMVRQRDFKRMLGYSSVEHMGILILGFGLGGLGTWASVLHMINNGLTKGILFLSAGNIHRAYATKHTADVRGALQRLPISGAMFLLGFLAITGLPPFSPFISEFAMLSAAFRTGHYWAGGLFAAMLLVVFLGFGATVIAMVFGKPSEAAESTKFQDSLSTCWPMFGFAALILLLGLYLPPQLVDLLDGAVKFVESMAPAQVTAN